MSKTLVLNLATGEELTFINDLSPVENLITAYMQATGLASQLHNPIARDRVNRKVLYGRQTAGVGDFAVRI